MRSPEMRRRAIQVPSSQVPELSTEACGSEAGSVEELPLPIDPIAVSTPADAKDGIVDQPRVVRPALEEHGIVDAERHDAAQPRESSDGVHALERYPSLGDDGCGIKPLHQVEGFRIHSLTRSVSGVPLDAGRVKSSDLYPAKVYPAFSATRSEATLPSRVSR